MTLPTKKPWTTFLRSATVKLGKASKAVRKEVKLVPATVKEKAARCGHVIKWARESGSEGKTGRRGYDAHAYGHSYEFHSWSTPNRR